MYIPRVCTCVMTYSTFVYIFTYMYIHVAAKLGNGITKYSLSHNSLPSAEASKYLLQYLAQCSGHAGKVDLVKDRLIQSNPVLEVSHIQYMYMYYV